jgi:hypothetical protein
MAETKVTWQDEDIASQALVEPMINDIGIENPEVRAAVKEFCANEISEETWTMGELQHAATCFAEGYKTALSKATQFVKLS